MLNTNQDQLLNRNACAEAAGKTSTSSMQAGKNQLNLLCASRSKEALDVANIIRDALPVLNVQCKHISNGHADPLYGYDASTLPDLVLFIQRDTWEQELSEYAQRPSAMRPPLIVLGDGHDPTAMRAAMKAGARDYLVETAATADLVMAFEPIIRELLDKTDSGPATVTAVINAKGGSGASLLATNIAHTIACTMAQRVGLIDLDLQFGSACQYLDLSLKRGLIEALGAVDDLDEYALQGYMASHESGLRVMSTGANEDLPVFEPGGERLMMLLELLGNSLDHIVLDLPRQINDFTAVAIERADQVILVTQQSISALYDTKRLLKILRRDLGVDQSRIIPVVNRYQKNLDITLTDVETALAGITPVTIANDYITASGSLNDGKPLYDFARSTKISKQIVSLSQQLCGYNQTARKSFFEKLRSGF